MRRLPRAANRKLRKAGPGLLLVGGVCVVGLGLQAADDWHHHGEMGAGFFHLHFHVGNHDHPDFEHSHAGRDSAAFDPIQADSGARRSKDEVPGDGHPLPADGEREGHAVLTVSHAGNTLNDATPKIEVGAAPPREAVTIDVLLPRVSWRSRTAAPRGPPT